MTLERSNETFLNGNNVAKADDEWRSLKISHAQLPPAGEARNVSNYRSPIKPVLKSYIKDSFTQTRIIINLTAVFKILIV